MGEYIRFMDQMKNRKEQICHELALAFASKQDHDENDKEFTRSILGQFETNERMLCEYAWCYDDLSRRFDEIIKRYCDMRDEKLNR